VKRIRVLKHVALAVGIAVPIGIGALAPPSSTDLGCIAAPEHTEREPRDPDQPDDSANDESGDDEEDEGD